MFDPYKQTRPTIFTRREDPSTIRIRPGINLDKSTVNVLAECSTRAAFLGAIACQLPMLKYHRQLKFSFEPMPRTLYDVLYKDFVEVAEQLPFRF